MSRNKNYIDVEISRERRLWLAEIRRTATPILFAGAIIFKDPKNRESFKNTCKKIKDKFVK